MEKRPLLILDIDETLLHATEISVQREFDFMVGELFVYVRPHVSSFLSSINSEYELACWSSATAQYLDAMLAHILPNGIELAFVWDRQRCTVRTDFTNQDQYFLKDLRKLKRKGFDLRHLLILEDEPRKVARNYGNAIYVKPYFGQPHDDELLKLEKYLLEIASTENFRSLDKRGWSKQTFR
ncbi:MAG TPA: HAD family hydrolase [Drouetiella sp.]